MPVVFRTGRDGFIYQIWAQEQAASCAVASIWMARNQARQMTFAETEWSLAWATFNQVVQGVAVGPEPAGMTFDPTMHSNDQNSMGDMFSLAGTTMNQVAAKLRLEGLTVTLSNFPVVQVAKVTDATPALILLGWYNAQNKRLGGHFIVASRVTGSGVVAYLDPWDGGHLVEAGPGPDYHPPYPTSAAGRFQIIAYISA